MGEAVGSEVMAKVRFQLQEVRSFPLAPGAIDGIVAGRGGPAARVQRARQRCRPRRHDQAVGEAEASELCDVRVDAFDAETQWWTEMRDSDSDKEMARQLPPAPLMICAQAEAAHTGRAARGFE